MLLLDTLAGYIQVLLDTQGSQCYQEFVDLGLLSFREQTYGMFPGVKRPDAFCHQQMSFARGTVMEGLSRASRMALQAGEMGIQMINVLISICMALFVEYILVESGLRIGPG